MLRHSHIAIREALDSLAEVVHAEISSGEDDLGAYRYFDLEVSHEDGAHQRIRFASRSGDKMVHLLAEKIAQVSDLAAALFAVGVRADKELSISTDQAGQPARNALEIADSIAAMSSDAVDSSDGLRIIDHHKWAAPSLWVNSVG